MVRFHASSIVFAGAWLIGLGGTNSLSADDQAYDRNRGAVSTAAFVSPAETPPAVKPTSFSNLPRAGSVSRAPLAPINDLPVTNQTRQALDFYGGHSARATLSQLPRRTPIQSAPPRPIHSQVKPFTTHQADNTISPYLNLDRTETADDLPNYFTFVRPQFQQMDTNRTQQRDLQRLQRQLNGVSSTIAAPQHHGTRTPGTGTPSRFMDTAQFYGGARR